LGDEEGWKDWVGREERVKEIEQKRRNYRRWIGMRRTEEEYSIR
jgi:hypothetical protein